MPAIETHQSASLFLSIQSYMVETVIALVPDPRLLASEYMHVKIFAAVF